jgi:hypothetical protein
MDTKIDINSCSNEIYVVIRNIFELTFLVGKQYKDPSMNHTHRRIVLGSIENAQNILKKFIIMNGASSPPLYDADVIESIIEEQYQEACATIHKLGHPIVFMEHCPWSIEELVTEDYNIMVQKLKELSLQVYLEETHDYIKRYIL